ncbi:copper amine oxidase N-terminal domain-containing protein [Desulfotruncus alcoholivorax]|uniref:copper amine oxidase N-terminal domain-containing protein n=1 Tax=Desulfotruncus alcoholivorax TaxID=265477 RepID=UPI0003FFDC7A|nr:copper amine oxidase N-terminal domain-containing protein [Desulfotruncus alcoholivorax]
MRKLLAFMGLILVLALLTINLPYITHANAQASQTIKLFVNGTEIKPDVPPYIDSNTVTVKKTRRTNISLIVGQRKATVNGKTETLDAEAVIKGSRTMVPLRFVSEALGAKVEWKNSAVYITDDMVQPVDYKAEYENASSFQGTTLNPSDYPGAGGQILKQWGLNKVQTVTANQIEEMHGIKLSDETAVLDLKVSGDSILLKIGNIYGHTQNEVRTLLIEKDNKIKVVLT